MDLEQVTAWCRSQLGVTEDYPFGPEALVFRVGAKMFALLAVLARPGTVNLKCEPGLAEILRRKYPTVTPGYHQNKRHWNTVLLDGSVPDDELQHMLEDSYSLVVDSLPKALRPISPPA